MGLKNKKHTQGFSFNTEDYILYILNNLEPEKSDKIRLNKIAFFVEFAYLFHNEKPLSEVDYAAINNGPVINDYDLILKLMQNKKKITIDGNTIRPLKSPDQKVPETVSSFLGPLIEKYSLWSSSELISLSHLTDSYKITTGNGKVMGQIIDKHLAILETFFDEDKNNEQIDEFSLPVIKNEKLVKYGVR